MDEDRDLDRRLEAMYGSARPRAGYEDELWKRIQARRPWRRRLAAWLQPGLRLAPALAVVLVVALGVGFFATRVHPQVGTTTSFSSGGGGTAGGVRAGPGFGVLPSVPGATKSRIAAPTAAGAAAQP